MIAIKKEEFSVLCLCALRYCMGRQTYMPSLVQGIIKPYLKDIKSSDLKIFINDIESSTCFGDELIDKPDWMRFKQLVYDELSSRDV